MKITFLGPAYPYRGGIASFNERLAKQFSSEFKDVDIRTFRLQYPGILFPGKTQFSDGKRPSGIRITRELNSINPLNWIRTGFRINKERPDILLVRYWIPFLAPCLGTISKIARFNKYTMVIALTDNIIPHEKRILDRRLTKYFLKNIDGAVVMSDTVRKELESFRNDIPVRLTPHPLFDNYGRAMDRTEALKALNLDPNYRYMLFFGLIRHYKGLDLLLKAFADKRLRNKGLRLIIAGEFYENADPYKEIIRKNDLEDEVILFDYFIKDNEVGLFFSAADLVVQPYRSASQSGITQIAYQFNRPMLVTNVGGLKEIVSHMKCGYVVKPDPADISDAIVDFYDNNRRQTFSYNVKRAKDRFSWGKMTDKIIEVFYNCLLQQLIKAM